MKMPKNKKTYIKFFITVILIIIILINSDISKVIDRLKDAHLGSIFLVLLFSLIHLLLSMCSIWILTLTVKKIRLSDIASPFLKSIVVGYFTPAQIGEGTIAIFMKKIGINMQQGLAVFIINKIINSFLLVFAGIFILYEIDKFIFKIVMVFMAVFLLVVAVVMFTEFFVIIRDRVIKKHFFKYYDFFFIFSCILKKSPDKFIYSILINIFKLLSTGFIYYYSFKSVNLECSYLIILSVFSFSRIVAYIPVSISGIGILESSVIMLFLRLGFDRNPVISSLVIMRFCAIIIIVFILIYYLLFLGNTSGIAEKDTALTEKYK